MKVTQTKIFIAAANRYPERPLSLYVHIPFCHKLCYFCGCNKVITRHQHKADIYLDYLEKKSKRVQNYSKIVLRLKCIGAAVHRLIDRRAICSFDEDA